MTFSSATYSKIVATACLLLVAQPAISDEYVVQPGDSLGSIAQALLGDGAQWRVLCDLNADRLEDCDRIFTGMSLRLPASVEDAPEPEPVEDQPEITEEQPVAAIGMAATNDLNIDLSAARVGVLGEGGQLPAGWRLSFAGGAEGTAEVIATTADYLDIEITQTASSGAPILQFTDDGNWIDTQAGDSWTFSAELALISGSFDDNGAALIDGTERDEGGRSLGRINFTDDISLDDTLRVFSGQAVISDAEAVQMNPDFRIRSSGPWQAQFRIGRIVLEKES